VISQTIDQPMQSRLGINSNESTNETKKIAEFKKALEEKAGFRFTTFKEMIEAIADLNSSTLVSVEIELVVGEIQTVSGCPGAHLKLVWLNRKLNAFDEEEIIVESMYKFDERVNEIFTNYLKNNSQFNDPEYFRRVAIEQVLFTYRSPKNV